jgi:alkylated DNA repair dioxygenase AlkB
MSDPQSDLFDPPAPALPPGMRYEREFLDPNEEQALVRFAAALPLQEMNYKGYMARRRVVSFGGRYDFGAHRLESGPPLPGELEPLRARVAAWTGLAPDAFTQAMVAEYRPGTPLGWHRDVPDFEDVVGVSLLAPGVMRFRRYPPDAATNRDVLKVAVEPRSIYLLRGPARWAWQHSVAPARELRYSITWRTGRQRTGV